jgi:hypothetical protein
MRVNLRRAEARFAISFAGLSVFQRPPPCFDVLLESAAQFGLPLFDIG